MPRCTSLFADKGSQRGEREPTPNSAHVRIYPFCGMSDNSTKSNYQAGPAWKAPKLAAADGNAAVRCAARFQNLIMMCCTCARIPAPCHTYMIRNERSTYWNVTSSLTAKGRSRPGLCSLASSSSFNRRYHELNKIKFEIKFWTILLFTYIFNYFILFYFKYVYARFLDQF